MLMVSIFDGGRGTMMVDRPKWVYHLTAIYPWVSCGEVMVHLELVRLPAEDFFAYLRDHIQIIAVRFIDALS